LLPDISGFSPYPEKPNKIEISPEEAANIASELANDIKMLEQIKARMQRQMEYMLQLSRQS
jgi:hypothetical protein